MASANDRGHHPVLARLAYKIDCARQAAESALDIVFDQDAIVGYGGRSMVFLSETAILKIYTHRPAERAEREITGLTLTAAAPGLQVPEVLGHDSVDGALAWVSATRLDGAAPTDPHDDQATALLGAIAARLHRLPKQSLAGLAPFRRNIRQLPDDDHPVRTRLTAVLAKAEQDQTSGCVPGFVYGDFSARNVLLAPGTDPGVIDFEDCGTGCVYEDLTTLYAQNCLIDGRDVHQALTAYQAESARLGRAIEFDPRHLLLHTARYFRWVLQWAIGIDTELADQVTELAPRVLDGLEAEGTPPL
ncbi:phosphotransferase enzyme family protein [Streptomyces sp. NPDC058268]|uniref:phosphotransferase enzyme family protein n=1 Tax=Streptomyces sp. NPDC058268 TaxID=3346413 RepID=UPI0036EBCA62